MNKQLIKKICAFVITVTFSSIATAQIVYTDVTPDTKLSCSKAGCSHQYNLDLNNDGINDFTLSVASEDAGLHCRSRGNNSFVSITPLNTNEVVGFSNIIKLLADTIISDQSVYTLAGSTTNLESFRWWYVEHQGCYEVTLGDWSSSADGYIGLKLKTAGLIYYGWVRLSVSVSSTSASFTIKDYAYNSVANRSILAGEKSCAPPSPTLSVDGPLSFCAGDSVTLIAKGTGYLYQWKKNGKNIPEATLQTYVAKNAGIYKCKETNSCGSTTTPGVTVTVNTCLAKNTATSPDNVVTARQDIKAKIIVTPNPVQNSLQVNALPGKTLTGKSATASINIYSEDYAACTNNKGYTS
jgi:hypothetical protein